MHRSNRFFTYRPSLSICLLLLVACAGSARADINLGLFALDEDVLGAVNVGRVDNSTFIFAFGTDFPVVNLIVFENAELIFTDEDGTVRSPISLGNIGPGSTSSPGFDLADLFLSAEFRATLSSPIFELFDGTFFQADTTLLSAILLPSSGRTLVAGDVTPITVSGTAFVPAVPEPSAWLLLGTALGLVALQQKSARRKSQRNRNNSIFIAPL